MTIGFSPTASLRKIRERKKNAIDKTFQEWETRGIPTYAQPDDAFPQLPKNISDLENSEIERRMVVFRRWDNFISEQMLHAKVLYEFRADQLKSIEARLIEEMREHIGEALEKRRVAVKANEDYMGAEEDMRRSRHIFDMFEMRHKQLTRDHSMMSRVIELRKLEQGGRGARDEVHNDVREEDRYASD